MITQHDMIGLYIDAVLLARFYRLSIRFFTVMDVFKVHDSLTASSSGKGRRGKVVAQKGKRRTIKHDKPSISRSDVLEKIQKLKATKEAAQTPGAPKAKAPSTEMFATIEQPEQVAGKLFNDPNNPATANKLKDALNANMINFSGKEREVLAKILNK